MSGTPIPTHELDDFDRALIEATQQGLPVCARPYHRLAETLGQPPGLVMERLRRMLASGVIRRIAGTPNHYRMGFVANGMTVWDVDDAVVDELGRRVGALEFVSHSYRRPRHPGVWPYNLFAMVHGTTRDECRGKAREIEALLGEHCRGHDILFSTRILKKTGFRRAKAGAD